jgi:hypothetical protein
MARTKLEKTSLSALLKVPLAPRIGKKIIHHFNLKYYIIKMINGMTECYTTVDNFKIENSEVKL